MSEVLVSRFHEMSEELAARIEDTLAEYAREHGHAYDAMAMRQSHLSVRELAQDALTFGMDIWTQGSGGDGGDLGGNVVRLPVVPHWPKLRAYAGARMALSIIGAVVGSTVIAAATTETVNLPYFDAVAHFIYSKNPAPEIERFLEENGHVYVIHAVRRSGSGEPWNLVHIVEKRELTPAEVAHLHDSGDNDDGTALNGGTAVNDPPFHG